MCGVQIATIFFFDCCLVLNTWLPDNHGKAVVLYATTVNCMVSRETVYFLENLIDKCNPKGNALS